MSGTASGGGGGGLVRAGHGPQRAQHGRDAPVGAVQTFPLPLLRPRALTPQPGAQSPGYCREALPGTSCPAMIYRTNTQQFWERQRFQLALKDAKSKTTPTQNKPSPETKQSAL